jgi:hypothetical protein
VFTLIEKLFRKCYIIGLDSYYSSTKLLDMLNGPEMNVAGTVSSSRRGLRSDIMGKKLKKGKVAPSFKTADGSDGKIREMSASQTAHVIKKCRLYVINVERNKNQNCTLTKMMQWAVLIFLISTLLCTAQQGKE